MENQIKSINVNADNTPIIKHYNGSWHVIDHTSVDGHDYSIKIWEWYYAVVDDMFEDVAEEDFTNEMAQECWEMTLEQFEDFGVKIVK